jgi:hypothetical protein
MSNRRERFGKYSAIKPDSYHRAHSLDVVKGDIIKLLNSRRLYTHDEIIAIVLEEYGIEVGISAFRGWKDRNVKLIKSIDNIDKYKHEIIVMYKNEIIIPDIIEALACAYGERAKYKEDQIKYVLKKNKVAKVEGVRFAGVMKINPVLSAAWIKTEFKEFAA